MATEQNTGKLNFKRISCFDNSSGDKAFESSFVELLQKLNEQATQLYISPENVQRYNHGGSWDHPAQESGPVATMQTITTVWNLPWQSLVDNDLNVIENSVGPITESMERQFAQMMYKVVGDAAERAGNVVDAKQHENLAEGFIAALEKIEFGVGRDGEVSLPEFHLAPDMHKRLLDELQAQGPEFDARVEAIKAAKAAKALAGEAERKARFKRSDL